MITREMLKNRPKYITELTPDNIHVGMTVRVKTVEQLRQDCPIEGPSSNLVVTSKYSPAIGFSAGMLPLCGRVFEIEKIEGFDIYLNLDTGWQYVFYPDWLEIA